MSWAVPVTWQPPPQAVITLHTVKTEAKTEYVPFAPAAHWAKPVLDTVTSLVGTFS